MRYCKILGLILFFATVAWLLTASGTAPKPARADVPPATPTPFPTPVWYAYGLVGEGGLGSPECTPHP